MVNIALGMTDSTSFSSKFSHLIKGIFSNKKYEFQSVLQPYWPDTLINWSNPNNKVLQLARNGCSLPSEMSIFALA